MEPLDYEYLISDFEGVILIDVKVEEDVISCNFAAIKKRLEKRQKVYCPITKAEFEILLPDEAVDQIVPVSMAGEIILHRVKHDTIAITS